MKEKSKLSWSRIWALHCRGVAILWKEKPGMLFSRGLYALVRALTPYVGIYLSALLVDELSGERNMERALFLAAAAAFSAFVLSALSECIKHWDWYENAGLSQSITKIYVQKMLDMDFVDMDNHKTHDLYAQIDQNRNWSSWGIDRLPRMLERLFGAVSSICGAAVLTAGLFLQKIPEGNVLAVCNSPVFIFVVLVFLFASVVLSSVLMTKGNGCWADFAEQARLGNRVWSFCWYSLYENDRAMELRCYRQQKLGDSCHKKYQVFGANGPHEKLQKKISVFYILSDIVTKVLYGLVYLFTCIKAWAGAFGIGAVTQYVGAVTALSFGLQNLFQVFGDMKNNAGFLENCFAFLDIPNRMYQGSLTIEKRSDCNYELEFRDVSFRYPNATEWALQHVSFVFRVGERLAVVGENGSGKTTFIKLLCRLYDPDEGQILLNGIDIRKYDYKEYMSIFSVVFQDFELLSYGLGENVAARKLYDKALAEKCLQEANFKNWREKMPEGLDTKLGKRFDDKGVEISGGEAQKVALARALYKNAPFIILDEPTAALDPLAEQEVYESFDRIIGDRTAVYISHRLSSCRFCDVIAVFDKGRLVQQGSHETLVAREDGKYYKLWHAQAQYYT